jgi:ADP-ribose pyrophosphatase YjhB (NUDIX family)
MIKENFFDKNNDFSGYSIFKYDKKGNKIEKFDYSNKDKFLVAVDSIILGFRENELHVLLAKRPFEPMKGEWSLMGGFLKNNESVNDAAKRVLNQLTGLSNVYMEQLYTFGDPGRDPRGPIKVFEFDKNVRTIDDLRIGMELPGIVGNITNFGAFVDIGIKENGLIHLSQLAQKYVSNPNEIVSIHQQVRVKVLSVDTERKRIQLTMIGVSG